MDDYRERIAVLETRVNDMINDFSEHRNREEFYMRQHSTLLAEIREEQAKMKGFWGGVVFVMSAMATAIGMVINRLFGE